MGEVSCTDENYIPRASEEAEVERSDNNHRHGFQVTQGSPEIRPTPARLSDIDVNILRDTAISLQNANIALTESLALKNKVVADKEKSLKRKKRKIEKLEEILKQESLINAQSKRAWDRDREMLRNKLKRMSEKYSNFKRDTAKLVAKTTRQMEVYSQKQYSHMQARSAVKYNTGYVDAGGILGRNEDNDGREHLDEAQKNERQALRVLNEHLSELFDLVEISLVVQR